MKKITLGQVVMVSDPCYTEPTWCQVKLSNVNKGTYYVNVIKQDEGNWGVRCGKLIAIHENYRDGQFPWMLYETGIIGVDSGQAGIFDYPTYRKDGLNIETPAIDFAIGRDSEGDEWYEKMCKFTLSENSWGVYDNGVVSSSGIGDGSYNLFLMEDGDVVVGMMIDFLPDEDDLDDDEDDLDDDEDDLDDDEK
jgi:hypothetical protein